MAPYGTTPPRLGRRLTVPIIIFILAIVILSSAQPQETPGPVPVTIWVSNQGSNDTNTCGTDKSTSCTISAAFVRAAQILHTPPSLEFLLSGGDYAISRILFQDFTNLTIRLAPNELTRARLVLDDSGQTPGAFGLSGVHLTIEDITFSNFRSSALQIAVTEALFRNLEFRDNIAQREGGAAVAADIYKLAKFFNCTFSNNIVQHVFLDPLDSLSGGAINIHALQNKNQVDIEFQSCRFQGNGVGTYQSTKLVSGGAISIDVQPLITGAAATVTIQDCQFEENVISVSRPEIYDSRSSSHGGAVSAVGNVRILISRSSFTGNKIVYTDGVGQSVSGGAVFLSIQQGSSIEISDSSFSHNLADAGYASPDPGFSSGDCAGGSVAVEGSPKLSLRNSTFFQNYCLGGGNTPSSSSSNGGAVSLLATKFAASMPSNVSVAVEACTFDGNRAGSRSGQTGRCSLRGGALSAIFTPLLHGYEFLFSGSSFRNNSVRGTGLSEARLHGGAVFITSTSSFYRTDGFSRMDVTNTSFVGNEALCEQCSKSVAKGGAFHLEVDAASRMLNISDSTFFDNSVHSDVAGSVEAVGGALSVVPAFQTLTVLLQRCMFVGNRASGREKARGGGIIIDNDLNYPVQLGIVDSVFTNNSLICPGDTGSWFCAGGALSTASTSDNITIVSSEFVDNTVYSVGCQPAEGGALSSTGFLSISSSSFLRNKVTGETASGGAISSWHVKMFNTSFERNYAEGYFFAEGGCISSQNSPVVMANITSRDSFVRNVKRQQQDSYYICSSMWGSRRPLSGYGAVGGSFALVDFVELKMEAVKIFGSNAVRGGAISMRSSLRGVPTIRSEISVWDSRASVAGGAVYIFEMPHFATPLLALCNSSFSTFQNVTAGLYGPTCATAPVGLYEAGNSASHVAAPLQKVPLSLVLLDGLGQIVGGVEEPLTVALLEGRDVQLRSGAARDSVIADEDGHFYFRDLSVLALPNSTALLGFTIGTPLMQREGRSDSIASLNITVIISGCLPSFYEVDVGQRNNSAHLDSVCQPCPFGTYRLRLGHVHGSECQTCDSEHGQRSEGLCLIAPKSDIRPLWTVASGFYPVPSLESPNELIRCPNSACLEFQCQPYTLDSMIWRLNCSSCPPTHETYHKDAGSDCHCEAGFEGRLCSRCTCTDHACYFASGSAEERECILCQSPSTIVIVAAISILQLSLVVFLIFKQSAFALVLSEIAIVIILVLLGIGEFWMFDLVLILGLLFVITSLSQRSGRPASAAPVHPLLQESEGEDDSHTEPRDHELASRSAAIVKIIIFFVQTTVAIIKGGAWPHWVVSSVEKLNALNLRVSGIECFAPSILSKQEANIMVQFFMPCILCINLLIAVALSAICVYSDSVSSVRALLKKCNPRKPNSSIPAGEALGDGSADSDPSNLGSQYFVGEESPLLSESVQEENVGHSDSSLSYDQIIKRVQFSVLFLLSASYFELSNVVFETLRPCSYGHMVAFPFIPCSWSDSQFISLVVISTIFLLLYTLGIPAFFGIIMRITRRRILSGDPNIESRVGFLYESYKRGFFWWELVWFLRRILLSISVTMLVDIESLRTVLTCAILLCSVFLQRAVMPFGDRLANFLDIAATTCILFSIILASEIKHIEIYEETLAEALKNVVLAVNLVVILALIVALALPSAKSIFKKLKMKLHME
eukprot:TRINITY_DN2457_c0_g2_i2.p1 TRINITY_DN2457_c0_g2~~TRINITY_DN2457_c0_g2_i2.p1  ORF type:complete len:1684 (-),score=138.56 TRINITY_DN2457_c0_g2_i2:1459-6510(-)